MIDKAKRALSLLLTFLKIGALTFGGGYAMIPLIQRETVEKKKWISDSDILDIVAIAESTPGPIAINSATFVGYRVAGFIGAFAATLGVVLPSFVIIYLISLVLNRFEENTIVKYAFAGIRAGVLALIIKALYMMYKQAPKHIVSYVIMAAAFAVSAFTEVSMPWIIIGCAAAGIISSLIMMRKEKKNDLS